MALVTVVAGCSSTATRARAVPTPSRPSGEAGKPATTIISDARKALLASTSVHVMGAFTAVASSGAATSMQRLDLRLTRIKGTPAATGTVTTVTGSGAKASTVTLSLIRLGSRLYVRGDRAYYARIGPKAAAVAGHWLALPVSQDESVASVTDLTAIAAGFSGAAGDRVEGTRQLGDTTVVVVTAGPGASLSVSATGAPRPVRLQRSDTAPAGVAGTLDFSEYDAPLTVAAPAGAVDLATVRG